MKRSIKRVLNRLLGPRGVLAALKVFYFGSKARCPVCKSHVRTLLDQGYGHSVLCELQVIGGIPRKSDECPVCRSNSRTRLVHFYLSRVLSSLTANTSVLHVAPERGLMMFFLERGVADYECGDLSPGSYLSLANISQIDLTRLPYADSTFELVVCNHVLEHIEDDAAAMREIHRVLKDGGLAILQVPISQKLETIREGLPAKTDDERIRLYGQHDHVRIYTLDAYVGRLRSSGFSVELFDPYEADAETAFDLGLDPFEKLVLCTKAS